MHLEFYIMIVNENSHTQSELFSVANRLLVPKSNLSFPDFHDKNRLVNELGQYFSRNVEHVTIYKNCKLVTHL